MKVHQNGTDGVVLHTGQLFFEESLNEMIEEVSPYSEETVSRVLNANDGIYNQGGSYGLITSWSLVGSDISEGVKASINVEVDGPTYYDGEDEYQNDITSYSSNSSYSSYSTFDESTLSSYLSSTSSAVVVSSSLISILCCFLLF